jgi:hypothetical protein
MQHAFLLSEILLSFADSHWVQASDNHLALFSGEGRAGFVGGKLARSLAAASKTSARRPVQCSRAAAGANGEGYNRSADIMEDARQESLERVAFEAQKLWQSGKQREADELWSLWNGSRNLPLHQCAMPVDYKRPEAAGLVMSLCLALDGRTLLHCAWTGDCRFAVLRRKNGKRDGGDWFRCHLISAAWKGQTSLLSLTSGPCRPFLMQAFVEEGDIVVAGSPGFWLSFGACDDVRLAAQLMNVVNQRELPRDSEAGKEWDDVIHIGRRLRDVVLHCSHGDVTIFVSRITLGAGCIGGNGNEAKSDASFESTASKACSDVECDHKAGQQNLQKQQALLEQGMEELGADLAVSNTNHLGPKCQ